MQDNSVDTIRPVIPQRMIVIFAVCWALVLLAGFAVVHQFAASEEDRMQQDWQRQLQLTAEVQRRQVEQWVEVQQATITGLAQNTSLQLYITEINQGESGEADQAFSSFLRNLLVSEAQQRGYYEPVATESVPANLPTPIGAGLAIINKVGTPIVSTRGMPALKDLPKSVRQAFRGRAGSPIGPFLLKNDKPYLLFTAPISSVGAQGAEAAQGYIIGMKAMGAGFDELLSLPPQAADSSESILIRKKGDSLEYLTTLADGTKPLSLKLNADTPDLVDSYSVANPGVFSEMNDYRGTPVLAVGQPISGTDWALIHKVDSRIASAPMMKRKQALLGGYWLVVSLITVALIAIWRNISASRAKVAAAHFRQLTKAAEKQKSLLSHLINTLIMLVDSRDPHAQQHSNSVAIVAEAVAEQMDLSTELKETTKLAALLMNVGKIKTSETLLVKKDLTAADKDQIRQDMLASAGMLEDVAFNGPVVETLQQSLEHVDGSGQLGLKDNEILVPAKIIAVANAFIAMISSRAYRDAMSIDKALDVIHSSVDGVYARSVVAALEHYLENGGGRAALGDVADAA